MNALTGNYAPPPATADELRGLVARLEAATGPDVALDLALARALKGSALPWPFTSSLDAAVLLVPELHDWVAYGDNGRGKAGCEPAAEEGCWNAEAEGATPAIALSVAALMARITVMEGTDA